MKKLLLLSLCIFLYMALSAQTVTNVVAKQVGNKVEITYDLDKSAIVNLLLSKDGGNNYTAVPKTVNGDIGSVTPGHKKIVWDMLADGDSWTIDKARFKIVIEKSNKTFNMNGVEFTMVYVEGGTFTMGQNPTSGAYDPQDNQPAHQVTVSNYYIGETEVTQGLWKAVMKNNPVKYAYDDTMLGDNYPVVLVNLTECEEFVKKLNYSYEYSLGGMHFAIPTEAQWEYAAKGGHKPPPYQYTYSGSDIIGAVAWYRDSPGGLHPVARKAANTLGIYDMSGNAREWCIDKFAPYSSEPQINPRGSASGTNYVVRGGSYCDNDFYCSVSHRDSSTYNMNEGCLGLRIVLY